MAAWPQNASADLYRVERRPTQMGGLRHEYPGSPTSTLACRFQQGPPTDVETEPAERADLIGTLYFDSGVDVKRGDMVIVNGITGYVVGISEPSVPGTYLKAWIEEKQPTVGNP